MARDLGYRAVDVLAHPRLNSRELLPKFFPLALGVLGVAFEGIQALLGAPGGKRALLLATHAIHL
ncbi:hypothetical protein [Mycobacteroides abscessus]|uniref:hypothetical protein n=1 Tax=Mycobacteroides abscessus TaxID=36809 RepID=UPI001042629F|nr:hypothetical protein [Mycobacteroides abscessus]